MLAKEFMLLQLCLIYNYEVLIRDLLLQVLMQHFKVCVCVCVCVCVSMMLVTMVTVRLCRSCWSEVLS